MEDLCFVLLKPVARQAVSSDIAHARLRSMSAPPPPSRAWRLATRGARVMKNSREARPPRIQETRPVANPALRHDTQTDCNWGPVNRAAPPGLRQWSQG